MNSLAQPTEYSIFSLIAALDADAGIDPAFDSDMEELERQFAEYRLTRNDN